MNEKIAARRRIILMIGAAAVMVVIAFYLLVPKGIESVEMYVGGRPAGSELKLTEGDNASLTVKIEPEEFSGRDVQYTVSDPAVLKVSDGGSVTAVKKGEAVVSAEAVGVRKSIRVKVDEKDPGVKDIEGIDEDMFMRVGSSVVLRPELVMESDDLEEPKIIYRTGDEKVVEVYDNGGVAAVGPGETTITVKAGKVTKKIKVTIEGDSNSNTNDAANAGTTAGERQ